MDTATIDLTDEESLSFQNDTFFQNESDIIISSDEDFNNSELLTDDELPEVELKEKKSSAIRSLFPANRRNETNNKNNYNFHKNNGNSNKGDKWGKYSANAKEVEIIQWPSTSKSVQEIPKPQVEVWKPQVEVPKPLAPGFTRMIEGVSINLPVQPYGSQVALMSMLIKGIKRNQNCLLESPTGSGKTLALLCGALGWLSWEKKNIAQQQAENYFSSHPSLKNVDGAMDYVTSPQKNGNLKTPQKMFTKNTFGEKSIYDKTDGKSNEIGQVRIHKRKRIDSPDESGSNPKRLTPEKNGEQESEISQKLKPLLDNLHIRVWMCAHSSVPKIYYGARTHKQLQQVIKEFKRTCYCGDIKMSLLSSREYSCIREYDKNLWPTKNDMCKSCTKKISSGKDGTKLRSDSNCKYYDNYRSLNHSRLPSAFDLEDLVKAGHELSACPYFAAREVAKAADIVFCPYNYLIEPTIRNSMGIDLNDNILIIDEAHNIEDICRDAASFTIAMESVQSALEELEHVAKYRYENEEAMSYVDYLLRALKDWEYWFVNQMKLLEGLPFNNNEAVYDRWQVEIFAKTLDNHNIGSKDFCVFKENAQMFCTKLRDDPDLLYGVTQATATLLESIAIALGYLFREEGKFMDDFKPALIKTINNNWKSTSFNRKPSKPELISLKLICMNPAVVFDSLKAARCIVLASGTLTPLISLHSELNTEFPIRVSPSHVIPSDRVWIGTLTSHRDGRALECKSRDTNQVDTQDTLGDAILWVCGVTPHGVLCFVPSYQLLNKLVNRWIETGVWKKLNDLKNVFQESRVVKDHNEVMDDYYNSVSTDKGAILFAVYRGKVSEGMDFKDHQARAVITIGVPYPNTFDRSVKAKMDYNDKYAKDRNLLTGRQWLQVQAYRALNQAVGRCVRHKGDWGAVLLIDARFQSNAYTEHLSKWVINFLENNHHSFDSLIHSSNSLESFMQNMTLREKEDM